MMFGTHARFWASLIFVGLVAACTASGPEQALREYWEAMAQQDTARVMELLHNPEIQRLTEGAPPEEVRKYRKAMVASAFKNMRDVDPDDFTLEIRDSRIEGDTASVDYSVEGGGDEEGPISLGQETTTARLIKVEGAWRVASPSTD